MLRKGDIIIICLILSAVLISFAAVNTFSRPASFVIVRENNELIFEGSINENRTVELAGNTLRIENGKVWVSEANCKNRICMSQGKISKSGESIICLPNRVIIEIE